jgi:hypothetical protein
MTYIFLTFLPASVVELMARVARVSGSDNRRYVTEGAVVRVA